jgi:8-oxo-dGTP pyrophosphatase MutT (NUDIX family)
MNTAIKTDMTVKPASTVILLREKNDRPQVYLLQRSQKSGFMAGNYVFPGGTLDTGDFDFDWWQNRIDMDTGEIAHRFGNSLSIEDAAAYGVAAIRETFEEAGVLIAHRKDGDLHALTQICKNRMVNGISGEGFREEIAEGRWRLQFSKLFAWSRWITPRLMPRRYDTRFFITLMPEGQVCRPDNFETTHGLWVSPEEGLAGNLTGDIPLSPPTLVTLSHLMSFNTVSDLRKEMAHRLWGDPIKPRLIITSDGPVILEPWDPMWDQKTADVPTDLSRRILPPGVPFSRIWRHNGIWKPVSVE